MFQTAVNHFFQGFGGRFSDWFMNFMSDLGSFPVYFALILAVIFGWNLRKGFFLMHIMVWAGMTNSFMKDYFNLPRPLDIDETLRVPGPDYNHINLDGTDHSAAGFFQMLSHDVIDKCRAIGLKSPGFPSGHAASVAGFWITLPLLAKKTWLWILGLLAMLLIMISRLYLGAHFLADITGGFLSGVLIVIIGFLIYYMFLEVNTKGYKRFPLYTFAGRSVRYLYYLGVPVLFSFIPSIGIVYTAPLLGINLVIITSDLRNIEERGQIWERIIRVVFAYILYLISVRLISFIPEPQTTLIKFIEVTVQYFIVVRLSISICIWTRLYRRLY